MLRKIRRAIATAINTVDKRFYIREYPDVGASGMDAADHYKRHGAEEGRFPNGFVKAHRMRRERFIVPRTKPKPYTFESPNAARDGLFYLARSQPARKLEKAMLSVLPDFSGHSIVAQVVKLVNVSKVGVIDRIEAASSHTFREPAVYGETVQRPIRTVETPSTWIAQVLGARIIGGFQVVKGNQLVIYEPAADLRKGFVAGVWQCVSSINKSPDRAIVWFEYDRVVRLPEAVLISGRCSPNYFHWLIEYLTRLRPVMRRLGESRPPLLIDADMYPQEFESLKVVAGDWPIHLVGKRTLLEVEKLHIPSIPTFHPDWMDVPFWAGSALNPESLRFLRDRAYAAAGLTEGSAFTGRRIYIARRQGRNILNAPDVERALESMGFEAVDTGQMGFLDQVKLFASAEFIVGAMGAGFTNAIFCDRRCKMVAMGSPFGKRFSMQSNLASFAGADYLVVAGEHEKYTPGAEENNRDLNLLMESFSVSIDDLVGAVQVMTRRLEKGSSHLT
ncbi:glycosyltransferase family 61 protein [Achromobacter sp. ESBL13]|uniref:glycosyltransferase family 61 protein n=1 Tax=Achromobacter sp. ESBL13 TaxID=3077328 RepID=UPI002FCBB9C8